MMPTLPLLSLLALATIAVNGQLHAEPVDVVPIAEPGETLPCEGRTVTACRPQDFTLANWQAFDIDSYLIEYITEFGAEQFFPGFFATRQTPPGSNVAFGCTSVEETRCVHPDTLNPDLATDCVFSSIANQDTVCKKYIAPQAAFIIQNYINLWQGTVNHYHAVNDAAIEIARSGFIDDIVAGLSLQKRNVLDAVKDLFKSLIIAVLPIGGDIAAATTFIKKLGVVLEATGVDLIQEGQAVFQAAQEESAGGNALLDAIIELRVLVSDVVKGVQASMQVVLRQVFDDEEFGAGVGNPSQAIASKAFKLAQSGRFLEEVPSREAIAAQIQKNLENWIVSTVMNGMGWGGGADATALEGPPGEACRGNKGIQVGRFCALIRKGNDAPENPEVLNRVDFFGAFQNAEACQNGVPDFVGLIKSEDNSPGLPKCFYSFPILMV